MEMRWNLVIIFTLISISCGAQMWRYKGAGRGASSATTYATYNATYVGSTVTLIGANLVAAISPSNGVACATIGASTTGKSSGKWHWEITNTARGGNSSIGVTNSLAMNLNTFAGADSHGWTYYSNGGGSGGNWQAGSLSFGWTDYVVNDIIAVELDAGGNQVSFYRIPYVGPGYSAPVFIGTLAISGGNYFPCNSSNFGTFTANYGQSAFVMTPSSGYNSGYY